MTTTYHSWLMRASRSAHGTSLRMRTLGYLGVAALLACGCGGPENTEMPTMQGGQYLAARMLGNTFCGDCHTKGGKHFRQPDAYLNMQLDFYENWKKRSNLIEVALTVHGTHADMPPPYAPQPSDAERQLLIDWLARGAPNTPDGQ